MHHALNTINEPARVTIHLSYTGICLHNDHEEVAMISLRGILGRWLFVTVLVSRVMMSYKYLGYVRAKSKVRMDSFL